MVVTPLKLFVTSIVSLPVFCLVIEPWPTSEPFAPLEVMR